MREGINHITFLILGKVVYIDLSSETIGIEDDTFTRQIIDLLNTRISGIAQKEWLFSATTISTILEASRIKPQSIPYQNHDYEYQGKRIPLKEVKNNLPGMGILELLHKRRSYRDFGSIDYPLLSNLLYHGARVRDIWIAPDDYKATSRPAPSAGGRHPIDLLCVANEVNGLNEGIYLFDPFACELIEIRDSKNVQEELTMEAFTKLGENAIPPVIIYFIAQLHRTFTRYPGAISFIYRDSGALLATLSLVATSLGLYSCGVGTSGTQIINELLGFPFPDVVEVGGIAIGGEV